MGRLWARHRTDRAVDMQKGRHSWPGVPGKWRPFLFVGQWPVGHSQPGVSAAQVGFFHLGVGRQLGVGIGLGFSGLHLR